MFKHFKFKFDFEFNTLHTMDCYDPDIEAFESSLCATIWAKRIRQDCSISVQSLPKCIRPSIGLCLNKGDTQQQSHCCISSHAAYHLMAIGQSDSDNSPDDHKTSSLAELKFEEHLYFAAGSWPAGKTYEDPLGQFWQQWMCSIYQLFLFLSGTGNVLQFGSRTRLTLTAGT